MNILICDDNQWELDEITHAVTNYTEKKAIVCKIKCFTSPAELLSHIKVFQQYDLALLDIDMPGMTGIDLAANYLTDMKVIFITHRDDLVFSALSTQPFGFVRKKYLKEELLPWLEKAITLFGADSKEIVVSEQRVLKKIQIKELVYVEAQGHYSIIKCCNNEYRVKKGISVLEKELDDYGFIRIHDAYLVNPRYIKNMSSENVTLIYGKREMIDLRISRGRSKQVKILYMQQLKRLS